MQHNGSIEIETYDLVAESENMLVDISCRDYLFQIFDLVKLPFFECKINGK